MLRLIWFSSLSVPWTYYIVGRVNIKNFEGGKEFEQQFAEGKFLKIGRVYGSSGCHVRVFATIGKDFVVINECMVKQPV